MRNRIAFAFVIVLTLLLAGTWMISRRGPARGPDDVSVDAQTTPDSKPVDLAEPEARLAVTQSQRERETAANAVAPTDRAEIRGRVLLPDGNPASAAVLHLQGWNASVERFARFGAPAAWKDLDATCDSEGRFKLRFDPPRAFQFMLEADLKGYCKTNRRWDEIEPGAKIDVGDLQIQDGGSIRGRIVDRQGRALTTGWTVYAKPVPKDALSAFGQLQAFTRPDAQSGEFLFTGLTPSKTELWATSRLTGGIGSQIIEVHDGEETQADIDYTGPDSDRCISLAVSSRPYSFLSGGFDFVLIGPGTEERRPTKDLGLLGFADLPPGFYRLELRDRRFEPWSKDGIQPGTVVDVALKGNASVALTVVAEDTSQAVTTYALDVNLVQGQSAGSTIRVHAPNSPLPTDGIFTGFLPLRQKLTVRAEGYADCELPLLELQPNEQRTLVATLARPARISGRVVSGEERTPVENASVSLIQGESGQKPRPFRGGRADRGTRSTATNSEGRFVFEGVSPNEFILRASLNRLFAVEQPLSVTKSAQLSDIELTLPSRSWLRGRLLAPPGMSFDGMSVIVASTEIRNRDPFAAHSNAMFGQKDELASDIGPDGSFSCGPIPAGEAVVTVHMPEILTTSGVSGAASVPGPSIDLGTIELAPNVETRRDFEFAALCPGRFDVHVTLDGAPASGLSLRVEQVKTRASAAIVTLGADGSGRSGLILPGDYRLIALRADSPFPLVTNVTRTLAPGETVRVDLDVRLFAGTFRVSDEATGRPLAKQSIMIAHDEKPYIHTLELQTDGEGRVTATLAAGTYRVSDAARSPLFNTEQSAIIAWTANGPSTTEVRLALNPR
ncbi:MAG: carboxypeptidase regulatory-like domain-containing protein [Planctomycetes bacterium]|nr:carboxypeptidase regulatory-like domain-containing protein [Planctomycetota bacterium]